EGVFALPAFSMGVDWSSEAARFALGLPRIEISKSASTQLSQARLVSPSLRAALLSTNPSFDLRAVMASARLNDFIETLRIQADLEDATLETDGVLPGFKGVRGFLDIGVREGDLSIDATSLSLHFPKLYPQPWVLDQVSGQLAYHFEDGTWRLGSGLLEATADSVRARGKLQMNITSDFGSRTWGLVIGAADFRLRDSLPFIPSTVPQSAIDWLDDAIVSGSGDNTGLIVHGSLDQRQPKEEKIYSIVIEANQTELEFDPDWPHLYQLEGGVHVSNQGIQAQDLQGVFFDAALGPASLVAESLSWDRGAERLLIDSPLSGSQGDLLNVLKETPVAASVNDFARQWQGGGALSGRLIIDVPLLEGLDPLLVDATVEMKDAHMVMPEFDLELTALDGMFRYATDGGLSAPSVSLRILDEPAQATIETEMVGAGGVTRINLGGEMVIAKLDDWLDLAILKFAEGRSRFEATLQIPFGGRVNQPSIELWSGLKGVTVSMPPPLAKISADSGRNLHLLQVFDDDGSEISFEIDDALTGVLKLEQNQVLGGLIQLGRPVAQAGMFDALRVVGQTAFVGAEEWIEFIEAFEEASQEVASTFRERLDELSISVDSLDFFGLEFERADLVVSATEEAWVFDVSDDEIKGRIQVNDSDTKRVEALIDYLALTSDASGDPLLGLKSEDLVPMRLDLRSLTVDGEDYGAWSFDVVPADAAVLIENLSAKVKGMEVLSSEPLVWQMAVRDPTSHFKGTIAVPDVRASLEAWGFATGLEGSDFLMQADFEWPGSPLNISETRLSGAFSMKGGKGKIVQADAASGALKLLGVFDFAEIAQRLSLDLANVLGEGHAFNEVGGSFNLTPGLIQTKDPVVISGPGSQLTFAGELAVPSEVIDYDLIVTLPLNKNLPWYAAYSAIATGPLVGAGVLLAQQVFKNQIDELTSLKYELTGTLEEPMVELVAVFDSSIRASTDEVMDASGTEATGERKSP
ncbi:MAG: YhdP family protein, partial [Pseudomonadales bacterium]